MHLGYNVDMGIFSSLNREKKEAIIILQIGTFLEYFDLMIYVHMSVMLNELFFPKTDPATASLIAATTFCLTFILRPFGALIFGYIGDTYGRKSTVIITTTMMAVCCVSMAILPTYAQIGITAAWMLIICRIVQGLSSMGEIIGAQIYLSETIKKPERYAGVTFIGAADFLGSAAALGVATAVLTCGLEWRYVFWFGALIAIVGTVARTALRETPDFVNAKFRLKQDLEKFNNLDSSVVFKEDYLVNKKVNQKTSLAYFFIQCSKPVWFFFIYIYCAGILKNHFNYSPQQIIQHNLIVQIIEFFGMVCYGYLSYKIYPLKIEKVRIIIISIFIILIPYLLFNTHTARHLLFIQAFSCLFRPEQCPSAAIYFAHFPVFKRFTYVSFLYATSRALIYTITSFALVCLTNIFNYWGLLIVFIPVMIGFKWGVSHFEKLEKVAGNYPLTSRPNQEASVVV